MRATRESLIPEASDEFNLSSPGKKETERPESVVVVVVVVFCLKIIQR